MANEIFRTHRDVFAFASSVSQSVPKDFQSDFTKVPSNFHCHHAAHLLCCRGIRWWSARRCEISIPIYHPWACSREPCPSLQPDSSSAGAEGTLLFLHTLLGGWNEGCSAEVLGSHQPFRETEAAPQAGCVVQLYMNWSYKIKQLCRWAGWRCGGVWVCWVGRWPGGRPLHLGKSFPGS